MPLLKPTEKENLNFIKKKKKEELQAGPAEQFSKRGGRSTSFEALWRKGGGVVGGKRKVGGWAGVRGRWG